MSQRCRYQIVVTSKELFLQMTFSLGLFLSFKISHPGIVDNYKLKPIENKYVCAEWSKSLLFKECLNKVWDFSVSRWKCNLRSGKWKTDWSRISPERFLRRKCFRPCFLWQSDFFSGEHSWGGDWGAEKEVWGFEEIQELKKRQLWTFWRGQGEQVRASVRMVDEAASILWKLQDHCEMKKYHHATSLKFGHVCTALSSHQYWRRQLSTEAQTLT